MREDGKIDLVLQKLGAKKVDDFSEVLLQYIKDHEGFTPLNDKSAAEDIYDAFGVSKKTFKKAVGDLYKKRLVVLEAEVLFHKICIKILLIFFSLVLNIRLCNPLENFCLI